jgi:hypothetical protein
MEPRNWDGPSIDRGVLKRLHRLDPQLVVTWSPYALDVMTSNPIEQSGNMDPETGDVGRGPVPDPAFYLWRRDECSTHHVFVNLYQQFTDREVLALERDIARFERPQDIMRIFHERDRARRDRALVNKNILQQAKIKANERRIDDLILGGVESKRQAKSFSFSGQTNHSTPGEIEMDAKEAGWELPEE